MRLTKSTTILLNVVLVLMALLLLKSLITLPNELYANNSVEYSVKINPYKDWVSVSTSLTKFFNEQAKEGWKYHSDTGDGIFYIFER